MDRVQEIEARMAATTKGDWVVKRRVNADGSTRDCWVAAPEAVVGKTIAGDVPEDILGDEFYPTKEADAEFIANAKKDMRWLLAEVKKEL